MSNANRFWYVLQTSFHRELQIQLQLNRMRIRSFIPMHYEETTESGRRRIRRKPAVHNLSSCESRRRGFRKSRRPS